MTERLVGALVVAGLAIAGFVLGGEYAPTLANIAAHGYALKSGAYDAVRIAAYIGILCGAVVLVSSIVTTEPAASQRHALGVLLGIGWIAAVIAVGLPVLLIINQLSASCIASPSVSPTAGR
ncbi:MAG: hypothetical protein DLM63_02825 [Solirubrobacterales bacterium]|nr:MAG: hypothetical protein DLM63_02825 [Solirubrobacterales bacterium]